MGCLGGEYQGRSSERNCATSGNFKQDHGGISDLLDSDTCQKRQNKAHEESSSEEFAMNWPSLAGVRKEDARIVLTDANRTD